MNTRKCSNCIKGIAIPLLEDVLCRQKGVVSSDYVCSAHKFVPLPKSARNLEFKCLDCRNFISAPFDDNQEYTHTLGICQLFKVRTYDGRAKNACSKFSQRTAEDDDYPGQTTGIPDVG